MDQRRNLYAYTSIENPYPEYLSANILPTDDVEITVRSPRKASGVMGDTAVIVLPRKEAFLLGLRLADGTIETDRA